MATNIAQPYRRLQIEVSPEAFDRLRDDATSERRSVREQAAWVLEHTLTPVEHAVSHRPDGRSFERAAGRRDGLERRGGAA